MPPWGAYIPVCQKLIISKYNHGTPHLKGSFMLNRNQVLFQPSPGTKMRVFLRILLF